MKTTRVLTLFLALALLALVLLVLPTSTARADAPVIVRVTMSGTTDWPCGDQTNWSNPCALQTALTRSVAPAELWVAAGTYTPTAGTDRFATFQLRDDIALYGGFAGGEQLRAQRNFTANVTILSGDLNGNDNNNMQYNESTRAENSYHVLTGSKTTSAAVLDGFTVTGGNASYGVDPDSRGGGMYNEGGSPTLSNVTFISNTASGDGGGMFNYLSSSPTVMNVTFKGNAASEGGGMSNWTNSNPPLTNTTFISNKAPSWYGGGMFNYDNSHPTVTNTNFFSNSAMYGGGMANYLSSSPTLSEVTFSGNSSTFQGGGIYNVGGSPTLTAVTLSGNSAPIGGGMYNGGSNPTLMKVTFSGNSAGEGGGMFNESLSNPMLTNVTFSGNSGGGMDSHSGTPTIRNTIFWGNGDLQISNTFGTPAVYDSVVQGGYPGTNIIATDPHFGTLGNYGGATQTLPLLPGSSAIDTGNNATCAPTDQRGKPRVATCDIGAFESQGFTLAKTSGDNQSTKRNTPFANPLRVTVSSAADEPVNGGVVSFAAPSSDASATPVTSTVTIAADGTVTRSLTANGIVGSYAVTAATAGAAAPVSFTLTNLLDSLYLPLLQR